MALREGIEIPVRYLPDTKELEKALQDIERSMPKIVGSNADTNIKRAIVGLKKTLGKDSTQGEIAAAFAEAEKAITETRAGVAGVKQRIKDSFLSVGNKYSLDQRERQTSKLKKHEEELEYYERTFGSKAMQKAKQKAGGVTIPEARRELKAKEKTLEVDGKLTANEERRKKILEEYIALYERKRAYRNKGDILGDISATKSIIRDIERDAVTEGQYKSRTDQITEADLLLNRSSSVISAVKRDFQKGREIWEKEEKEVEKKALKFGDVLTGTFLGTSIGGLFQTALRKGIDFFKDYDEVLTRTMMVTGKSREEVAGLTNEYTRLASQLSSTTKEVAAAQLVFYQQGLGTSEALKMTEAAIAISKTGGIAAAEAANRLTAAIRGYKLAAGDALDIADKMSALDAAAASSVDELTIAMQKSASQAKMAGLDLDYYMAYLSTMQEVTREAPECRKTMPRSIMGV